MGCRLSKIDTELVILCREREELIKGSRDSLKSLSFAHKEYFRSLQNVENGLRNFVGEALVIGCSSSSDTANGHQAVDELGQLDNSSTESGDDNNDDDTLSFDDSANGGLNSSEPQSENLSGHVLSSNTQTEGTSSEEVPARVLEQPQVPALEAQPQARTPDGSATFPPGGFSFLQPGNGQFLQSDHPYRITNSIGNSAYNIPDSSSFPNHASMESFNGYAYPPWNSFRPYQNEHAVSYGTSGNFIPSFGFNLFTNGASFGGQTNYPVNVSSFYQHESGVANNYVMDYSFNDAMHYQTYNHVGQPTSFPSHESSTWDHINPFNSVVDVFPNFYFQGLYSTNFGSNSMDFTELREREGIPDLEDELDDPIIMDTSGEECLSSDEDLEECHLEKAASKSVTGVSPEEEKERKNPAGGVTDISNQMKDEIDQKDLASGSNSSASGSLKLEKREKSENCKGEEKSKVPEIEKSETHEKLHQSPPTDESLAEAPSDTLVDSSGNLQEILNEIKDAFDTILLHGKYVSETLEPYHPVVTLIKGSSRASFKASALRFGMSRRRVYRKLKTTNNHKQNFENETTMTSCSLSFALEKLYIWENKLYKEVKDEEKLRKKYDKVWRKLKKLDDRGAEAMELDACRLSLARLMPRINVSISKVKRIARRVHEIRDEELQPQLRELISRLHKIWKFSSEFYTKQVEAIAKAQSEVEISCLTSDSSVLATYKLEAEVRKLGTSFISWIKSFKAFIVLLNNWLMKFLLQEPGEIPDANHSCFSSRLSMAIISVICNVWLKAVEKVSDVNVSEALNNIVVVLRCLRERMHVERHYRLKVAYLTSYHDKKLKKFCMENGVKFERDASFFREDDLTYAYETESPSLRALYAYLRPIRVKIRKEAARHEEGMKLVNAAASEILKDGFLPALESLASFSTEMFNAYEQAGIPNEGNVQ